MATTKFRNCPWMPNTALQLSQNMSEARNLRCLFNALSIVSSSLLSRGEWVHAPAGVEFKTCRTLGASGEIRKQVTAGIIGFLAWLIEAM